MEHHGINMEGSVTRATPQERLEALKAKYFPTPDNQRQLRDGDPNKIMDRDLYKATKKGDIEKFMDALEKVCESRKVALSLIFDQVTPSGNSLLHLAASSGSEDVVELILIYYPDLVTKRNSSEDTPLHVAVQTGSLEPTRKLIQMRSDSEIMYWKNKDSKSPLYLAAENYNWWELQNHDGGPWEILKLLLETSAQDEAYAVKTQGMSPLLAALEILRLLLEACARDEAYDVKIQGMSPVLAALGIWSQDILGEIIDRLPKLLHVRGEDGATPLHSAASAGGYWAVRFLLEKCPDLALQTDKNGSYPIHIACQGRSYSTVEELIHATWPDLAEIKDSNGQNILHVAAKAGNNRAVGCILEECDEECIKMLVNSKDVDGNTPLHLASMHNHCRVMLSLTSRTTPDVELRNNDKLTALDVAMESESLSVEDSPLVGRALLIAAGVPRTKGRDAWSPTEQSSNASKSSRAKWMKAQVNTRLLVATLVATVTFAAGFTFPAPSFAVVVLLWGHVTDFYIAELAYLSAGPLLLTALTGMTVAFMAAVIVAVRKVTWLALLVLYVTVGFLGILVMVLAALVFPFSRTAMGMVSLHYMAVVGQFKKIKWGRFCKY